MKASNKFYLKYIFNIPVSYVGWLEGSAYSKTFSNGYLTANKNKYKEKQARIRNLTVSYTFGYFIFLIKMNYEESAKKVAITLPY